MFPFPVRPLKGIFITGCCAPDVLRELIASNAKGILFYAEELIKMLIEDGVIVRGTECWRVKRERLKRARVPSTLTGILQARLDSLPGDEKEAL